jgi:2,4-dienoyl-CoA reductase-like NADH-dependent reductase (Old Yellow Enzyme family)
MDGVDFTEVLEEIAPIKRLFGIHFNVRAEQEEAPDMAFVRRVRPYVKGLLLCSGHVTERAHVDALLTAGAVCVGIAKGVLDEPGIIARLRAKG